jgi:gliding motility-associated-like protein
MKLVILFVLSSFGFFAFSQGPNCAGAQPFCTENNATFPASTSTTAQSGPNYGCLSSQPNPAWYYLQVATGGNINVALSNSAGVDIDFACWGPFNSLAGVCGNLQGQPTALGCGFLFLSPCPGNMVDCSYSTSATEELNISGAVAGQFYMILITNFSGMPTQIDASTITGTSTGSTNCAIVPVPLCNITSFTGNSSACQAGNTYTESGSFTVSNPPSTGTATVTVNNGTGTFTQTFNAPFANGTPINYSIGGILGNGAASSVSIVFSASPACTQTLNYTAPTCIPPGCFINLLTGNTSACQPGSVYTQTGTFQFTNAPATGTAVVTVNNGTGTFTQTFNAPFNNSTIYNYSIGSIPANSAASTVSVDFSAAPACTFSLNYAAPAACNCPADIGTFTTSQNGVVQGPGTVELCFGDVLDIVPAGGFVPPNEAFAPPGPAYNPGIGWMIYSCPPTVGVTPTAGVNVSTDPCFEGILSYTNLNEVNDMFWINSYPPGTFTNNTVYFVPLTFYSMSSNTYSYVNTTVDCYEMGAPVAVQYIPQFTSTNTQNCATQQVTASFVGGLPAVNGSSYSVVAGSLSPASAVFVNTTAGLGGTIVLGNVQVGAAYSFNVSDGNGCTVTVSGTMPGSPPVNLTYPNTAYCTNAVNPTPTIAPVVAGTFSASPAGLSINTVTGVVNLASSTPGTYTITFQQTGGFCPPNDTYVLTVNPLPLVDAGLPQAICPGGSVTLNGSGASTYTWDNGVTNGVSFNPISTTLYTVTGTSAAGCQSTDNVLVTVNPLPNVNAGLDASICNGGNSNLNASGANTYSWTPSASLSNALISNPVATPVVTTVYTVTGTDINGCINTDVVSITVNSVPSLTAGMDDQICLGDNTGLNASGAVSYSWSPAAGLSSTIVQNPSAAPVITTTYTVTGTDANGCVGSDQVEIVVNPLPIVNAGPDQIICAGANAILTASGANTYSWTNGVVNGVSFIVNATNLYTVTGTTTAGCIDSDNATITVEMNPVPTFIANDLIGCDPLTVTFTNTSGGTNCIWTFGDGTIVNGCGPIIHTFQGVGCYDVALETESANGCSGETTISDYICVTPFPIASFNPTPSVVSELNPVSEMVNTTIGATNYSWSFSDGTISNEFGPFHTFPAIPGSYEIQLIANTPFGCADTASAILVVFEELIYYVPNTFTPDGDEFNNTFKPVFTSGFDPFDYNLTIFNRWGEVVFESNNALFGWDGTYQGKFAPDGVYVWKIEFKTKKNDARKTANGHITILR